MENLYILLTIMIFSACSNDSKNKQINFNLSTTMLINLKDNLGNDLLNTENYHTNNIKILYENNGIATEFYDANLDFQKLSLFFLQKQI